MPTIVLQAGPWLLMWCSHTLGHAGFPSACVSDSSMQPACSILHTVWSIALSHVIETNRLAGQMVCSPGGVHCSSPLLLILRAVASCVCFAGAGAVGPGTSSPEPSAASPSPDAGNGTQTSPQPVAAGGTRALEPATSRNGTNGTTGGTARKNGACGLAVTRLQFAFAALLLALALLA